mgnify:CR=1 FL=1|tara:strand:- start:320 stop:640 length:321 start_codon:yes stop_codon:yes gene_type:complete
MTRSNFTSRASDDQGKTPCVVTSILDRLHDQASTEIEVECEFGMSSEKRLAFFRLVQEEIAKIKGVLLVAKVRFIKQNTGKEKNQSPLATSDNASYVVLQVRKRRV